MNASIDPSKNYTPPEVAAIVEAYLERQRRGERPSATEYIDRHPELASEIHEVFSALGIVEGLKAPANHGNIGIPQEAAAFPKIPGFQVNRIIGRGGMGVVFEAEQLALGRRVAALQRLVDLYASWHKAEPDQGYDAKADQWRAKLPVTDSKQN